ncbi:hypothetical protein [Herbiconiux solani]|uniref:hypothetical protein n=1 Tax=Herbiconiux solani TaxID=661329 RepID=UPI000825B939|nr:hypothetical protein [Herbiconiux solani]
MTSDQRVQRRTTIRLFSDYAPSVVWFMGPVAYEKTRLSDELVTALQEWDSSFYASLDLQTRGFKSEALAGAHVAEGERLARLLAREVGPGFEIEYDVFRGKVSTRSQVPAENPEAEAFFNELADAEVAQLKRLAELREESGPVRLMRTSEDGSLHEIIPSVDEPF